MTTDEHFGALFDECPVCGQDGELLATDCTEGHGADCPDRVCSACGTALFVDPVFAPLTAARRRRSA